MIEPTVGRVVWFWISEGPPRFCHLERQQPFAATIAYVIGPGCITISVVDHAGQQWGFENVPLWNGEGERPADRFCEWMPYQKGQAAKTEQLERAQKPTA